ncbi:EscU/YscU/HrcU family type III secretion system export apparatus switch protein [Thermanaeromonas toyohensis]|uniref:EscU/YscU/HrcU family type III secretion system export apparatus switch protein n=1 Tax=Thermanaeromonas toyohensis TaxID=161154 RepID=UPI001E5E5F97|nr:EscU/YscU/HrcU family type III secretion system export apparatus switch protein [Thermanaeromonas toyohensis]
MPRSPELAGALAFLAGLAAGTASLPGALERIRDLLWGSGGGGVSGAALAAGTTFITVVGPVAVATALGAAAGVLLGSGASLAWRVDAGRINPVANLAQVFSRRAWAEALRAAVRVATVGVASWLAVRRVLPSLLGSPGAAGRGVLSAMCWIALAAVAVAVLDWWWRRWEYERMIAMTPEELREETKETEGNPEVRRRLRQWMRRLAQSRSSLRNVRSASVVITNPTRYAVALRYRRGSDPAPVVVAKGTGRLAERIRAEALRAGVPVVPNPPLARALYRLEIGRFIPPELYRAVAEVLAQIWRLSTSDKRW